MKKPKKQFQLSQKNSEETYRSLQILGELAAELDLNMKVITYWTSIGKLLHDDFNASFVFSNSLRLVKKAEIDKKLAKFEEAIKRLPGLIENKQEGKSSNASPPLARS